MYLYNTVLVISAQVQYPIHCLLARMHASDPRATSPQPHPATSPTTITTTTTKYNTIQYRPRLPSSQTKNAQSEPVSPI